MNNIIDELSSVNLSDVDASTKISKIFDKIRILPLPIVDINEKYRIYRSTNITNGEEITSKARLSYKPARTNDKYQRASLPKETVFYATYDPYQESYPTINKNGMLLSLFESCPQLKYNDTTKQISYSVVGEWLVIDRISLFSLASTRNDNKSSYFNKIGNDYLKFLKNNGFEDLFIDQYNDFQNFITNQFNKNVQNGEDYEYMITAIFTKMIKEHCFIQKNIDGLIWQSAINVDEKLDDTLCLALFPESVDKKIKFTRAFKYCINTVESKPIIGKSYEITNNITDYEEIY